MYEFDFYKDPWMILIKNEEEFNAVKEFLIFEHGFNIQFKYNECIIGITNTTDAGEVCEYAMYMAEDNLGRYQRPSIKVNYIKSIGSVNFPQTKKTESELQLESVMTKLSELQAEAQRLQEIVVKETK